MYLLYLDDAGSAGNQAEEYFALGGICVFEAQADWFTREVDKLAALVNPANPEDVELHASTIFSRRQEPWKSQHIDEARGILKSVLQVVRTSYNTTRLFACAIEKTSLPNQDPVGPVNSVCCRYNTGMEAYSTPPLIACENDSPIRESPGGANSSIPLWSRHRRTVFPRPRSTPSPPMTWPRRR